MELILKSNHELSSTEYVIGVDNENVSEQLRIVVEDESLRNKSPYLEFKTSDNTTFTTPQLEIVDGVIAYMLPHDILKSGTLKVQVVLLGENNYVWKSNVKGLVVSDSINSGENYPSQAPTFLSEAKKLLKEIQEATGKLTTDGVISGFEFDNTTRCFIVSYTKDGVVTKKTIQYPLQTITMSEPIVYHSGKSDETTLTKIEETLLKAYQIIQSNENRITNVETKTNDFENRVSLLEEEASGQLYSVEEDSTSATSKQIPDKALSVFYMPNLGGCCSKSSNLLVFEDGTFVSYGVTFTISNGIIKVSGTATESKNVSLITRVNDVGGVYSINTFSNGIQLIVRDGKNYRMSDNVVNGATFNEYVGEVFVKIVADTTYNLTLKPMLVKGSTAPSTFEKGYSGVSKNYATSVDIVGKNLWDISSTYGNSTCSIDTNGWAKSLSSRSSFIWNATNDSKGSMPFKYKANDTISFLIETENLTINSGYSIYFCVVYEDRTTTNFSFNRTNSTFTLTKDSKALGLVIYGTVTTSSRVRTTLVNGTTTSPTTYTPYTKRTLLSNEMESIKEAVETAYGVGAMALGYIDFANKKFVKNMGKVDLGSLSWYYSSGGTRFGATLSDAKQPTASNISPDILCDRYTTTSPSNTWNVLDKVISINTTSNDVVVRDTDYTDETSFKTAMTNYGVILYYELATPTYVDLSTILQDIEINDYGMVVRGAEALGTIDFNVNNDLPIPSTERYLVKKS